MILKKGLLSIACTIIALSMVFTACSSSKKVDQEQKSTEQTQVEQTQAEQTTEQPAKKVVISFNGMPDEKNDKANYDHNMALIDSFQKKYPNIEVKPDTWQYSPDSFIPKIQGGTAPTVIISFYTEMPMLIDNGYVADITDHLANADFYKDLDDRTLEIGKGKDGKIYGIPQFAYTIGLMYNKKLFKEAGIVDGNGEAKPPETWDELAEYAKKLTDRKKNVSGFGILTKSNQGGWLSGNWIWGAGGEFQEKVDGKWKTAFNSPDALKAWQFLSDLRWKYDVLQPQLVMDIGDAFKQMGAGQIAMMLGSSDWFGAVASNGLNVKDIAITKMPVGPGGPDKAKHLMGGAICVINKSATPEEIDAGIKWINHAYLTMDREAAIKQTNDAVKNGGYGGQLRFSMFKKGSEQAKIEQDIIDFGNIPIENCKGYEESFIKTHAEAPYYTQQMYAIIDVLLQELLTNKNSNVKDVVDKAANDFQTKYLDQVK